MRCFVLKNKKSARADISLNQIDSCSGGCITDNLKLIIDNCETVINY